MDVSDLRRGDLYTRRALHQGGLGGNWQKGISYPRSGSYVLVFSDPEHSPYGDMDGWDNGRTYRYSGEWNGDGDMTFSGGNLALIERSPELHLFVREDERFRYQGRFGYLDHELRQVARESNQATAILFRLGRLEKSEVVLPSTPVDEAMAAGSSGAIDLRDVEPGREPIFSLDGFATPMDPAQRRALLEKAVRGHRALLLDLRAAFLESGARCQESRTSVDLLVSWKSGRQLIVEVKTLPEHVVGRVRLGLAQLYEYAYRLQKHVGADPILALAVDREITDPDWLVDFLIRGPTGGGASPLRFLAIHTSPSSDLT